MKLRKYLKENTGMGADGLSKQRLKTMIYKATKKFTQNKIYHDNYWQGPQAIWDAFADLNLNWTLTKAEYGYDKESKAGYASSSPGAIMPSRKEWHFYIQWDNDKGKSKKLGGYLTAAGSGTVEQPLDRYDLVLILY